MISEYSVTAVCKLCVERVVFTDLTQIYVKEECKKKIGSKNTVFKT